MKITYSTSVILMRYLFIFLNSSTIIIFVLLSFQRIFFHVFLIFQGQIHQKKFLQNINHAYSSRFLICCIIEESEIVLYKGLSLTYVYCGLENQLHTTGSCIATRPISFQTTTPEFQLIASLIEWSLWV